MSGRLANAVAFQVAWIACVGGGAAGLWWVGPLSVAVFALWQIPRSPAPRAELRLVLAAVAAGGLLDTAFIRAGALRYPSPGPLGESLTPVWIAALWAAFALTLNHSLAWLKGRWLLGAVLGAVGGPLSFWFGVTSWKAAAFVAPAPIVLAVLAASWSVLTPSLARLAEALAPPTTPSAWT